MQPAFIAQALQEFEQESAQQFSEIEAALLLLEQNPDSASHLHTVFRTIHTIKGSAGLFGLDTIEKFCHLTETVLDQLRGGEKKFGRAIGTLLLQCNDHVRQMVQSGCQELPLTPAVLAQDLALTERLSAFLDAAAEAPISEDGANTGTAAFKIRSSSADAAEPSSALNASHLRVDPARLDRLIGLLGELSITQSGATLRGERYQDPLLAELHARMGTLLDDIRGASLGMRMVPIGDTLNRFRRVVRDLADSLGKEVELEVRGGNTELDKSLVDKIADPLMHLVRNALDHGLETPEQRRLAGKSAHGRLLLHAWHEAGNVVLRIEDDGRGLNREQVLARALATGLVTPDQELSDRDIIKLIFSPGFSTATEVTNLSGRGVGMDVVKSNIEALRGSIQISDAVPSGMRIDLRLPLTLASFDGFMVRVAERYFVLPLAAVQQVQQSVRGGNATGSEGTMELRGQVVPLARLRHIYQMPAAPAAQTSIVILQAHGVEFGVEVDALVGQQQTVLKPLGRLFANLPGITGTTLMGDGTVALVLDVPGLLELARRQ